MLPLELIRDALSVFYPNLCAACDDLLVHGEETICTGCLISLPRTNFHLHSENPVAKQFWGKVNLEAATAYFSFLKGDKVQQLMHKLKYEARQDVGEKAGALCGGEIGDTPPFNAVDLILPVPLHPKKLRIRGYNQAACFGNGLATALNSPCSDRILRRVFHTQTQTRKSRFARYENMKEVFEVASPERIIGRHILLVDDVITTGSTLSACATVLKAFEGVKVSIATMAFAEM
jgi:ComF family protein